MAKEVSKKINETIDIVTLQNKDICNRICSTENDIKKHINAAEECILEALEGLRIDNIGGSGSGNGSIGGDIITNAILEKDIIADVTIGGISEGDTIYEGTTFTEFVERLFTVLKAGFVSDPTMEGYVDISKPTIKVSILEQDGTYSSISSNDVIKENSKLKIEIEIPTSDAKNTNAKIVETTTVLAHGYIRKKDDTIDIPSGLGDCEIGTKVVSEGNDYVDIVSNNGCFSSFEITDGTTKITAYLSDVNEDGSLQVKSVSKTYKVLSDSNYIVYAKSNKEETLDEIANKPNRVKTINKDSQIGGNLSDTKNSDVFTIKIETWGIVPELTTTGNVTINAPLIKVTKSNGEEVNPGEKLSPNEEITVNVSLNGKSTISGNSASLIKSTDSEFKYGWEKTKGTGAAVLGSGNCEIGTIISHVGDVLEFTGTKNGLFNDSNFKIEGNKISFTKTVGNENSEFSIVAKSGKHELLADDNYNVYALSSIGSSGKSTNMNNHFSCNKDDVLKTYNTRTSSVSRFYFTLLEELWSNIPTLTINNCAVSIAKPTIKVTKHGETTALNSPVELNPSDTLDIEITLNNSEISTPSAYYQPNESSNYLKYGWKLYKYGTQIASGDKNTKCDIELTTTKDSTDTHTFNTKTGAFSGLSTGTLKLSNVSVGSTGGTLKITSTPSKYTVSPKYDYRIYALSSFDNFNDSHSSVPGSKQYSGSAQYDTFTYTIKTIAYSPFFYWAINGDINWDLWDDNNPTNIYSGDIRTLLDEITNNISDEELSNIGMTKYNASEHSYSGGRKLDKGTFLVMVTKNKPYITSTPSGPNVIDDELHLIKTISRNSEVYKIYVFPDDKSAGSTWFDFAI